MKGRNVVAKASRSTLPPGDPSQLLVDGIVIVDVDLIVDHVPDV
jgi:hypothetical protein